MSFNLHRVNPGDLITADLMNQIMDALDSLDSRITSVGTGVVISQLIPSDKVQVLQDLRIVGSNFQYSMNAQRVFFGAVEAVQYEAGSSDSLLIVQVPDLGVLPPAGEQVTVTVSNLNSSASAQIIVVPIPNPVQGHVTIDFGNPSPNPIVPNATADFP